MKTRLLLLAFLIALTGGLQAQIINVPADQPTIQAGINVATYEDTVLVAQGTYYENISFIGKEITVASQYILEPDSAHIKNTIIDGSQPSHPDSASVVMFLNGEDTTSVICGFTIINGTGFSYNELFQARIGGGIVGVNSGATIIHNKIIENELSNSGDAGGGGICFVTMEGENWTIIEDNIISDNYVEDDVDAWGGGIYVSTSARITNNYIANNHTYSELGNAEGAGLEWEDVISNQINLIILSNNIIENNIAEGNLVYGAAICCRFSSGNIMNNEIKNNKALATTATRGGALCWEHSYGKVLLENNSIKNNFCTGDDFYGGAGISIWDPKAKIDISHNNFENNGGTGTSFGGAVALFDGFDVEHVVDGNLFTNNVAAFGAGLYVNKTYNLYATNNVFSGDSAFIGGGAIRFFHYLGDGVHPEQHLLGKENNSDQPVSGKGGNTHPVIVNNTFVGNSAAIEGGAILVEYAPNFPVIFNNIFWENEAPMGKDVTLDDPLGVTHIYNNDIDTDQILGNWNGEGNINENPEFKPGDSLCHLLEFSPCIGAGIESLEVNGIWYDCPPVDYEGEPRPGPDGNVDIGADELLIIGIGPSKFQVSSFNLQAYPNPSCGISDIRYRISDIRFVRLEVFDVHGRRVKTLVSEEQKPGEYVVGFDGSNLPGGIYLVRLSVGTQFETSKLILMK